MQKQSLTISMLGPFQVALGESGAHFRTDAARALLAYLAVHQGSPQRRDALAALLSPDRADSQALTYLRNRLTRLRAAIGDDAAEPPWLAIDRKQIALRTGADITIDVTRFEALSAAVARHDHRELAGCPVCLARLREAVGLVRGEFLAGLNFPSESWDSWLVTQRELRHGQILKAMTQLRDACTVRGEWHDVLEIGQRQLDLEAWLEPAHRAVIQAHFARGDENAARAQFVRYEAVLAGELGIEPEPEIRAWFQEQLSRRADVPGRVTLPADSAIPDNLPLQANRFFGRTREQALLLDRLVDANVRLVTLVGPGGIGKTRLALHAGARLKASFPDGVWLVDLHTATRDAEQIKIAVGEAADLAPESPDQTERQLTGDQVLAILRDKRMLLIFDNCESVLDQLGFMPVWLSRAPGVVILATSREPLNFQAESVVVLGGLPTGSDAGPGEAGLGEEPAAAEAMFAEQARMAWDGFELTAENAPQVRRICRLVDGLPLGIALAAAWVRRRSLAQIVEAIEGSLDFLSTRLRDVDPRHRSMRAVFETSWQMLASEEQAILAALAVFPADFSGEAADQVAGAQIFDLDLFCEKSLLQQERKSGRYVMHSLLRQFAAEKPAAPRAEIDRAFVEYFHAYAVEHNADYARLQPEWHNFSAAIGRAHAQQAWETVLGTIQALDEPWFRQARFGEMRNGLTAALGAAATLGDSVAEAHLLLRLGEVELELNEYADATAHLASALDCFAGMDDRAGVAHVKYYTGRLAHEQGQDERAIELFQESEQLFAHDGDLLGIARNLNLLAICTLRRGPDFTAAQAYLERSVELQRDRPRSSTYIETLRNLARTHIYQKEYEAAGTCLDEAAEISRAVNNIAEYAAVLFEQVFLYKILEKFNDALAYGYECLDHARQIGSLRWEALVKTQLGLLHQVTGKPEHGATLLADGLSIFQELGDKFEEAYSHYYLYKLYAETGAQEQSRMARQAAHKLSVELDNHHLQARLNADEA